MFCRSGARNSLTSSSSSASLCHKCFVEVAPRLISPLRWFLTVSSLRSVAIVLSLMKMIQCDNSFVLCDYHSNVHSFYCDNVTMWLPLQCSSVLLWFYSMRRQYETAVVTVFALGMKRHYETSIPTNPLSSALKIVELSSFIFSYAR